jgi:glycosyltransferase involved in cell wall biosynthesis
LTSDDFGWVFFVFLSDGLFGIYMRILLITDYLPFPPISGDTIRVYNIIRRIAQKHELSLLVLFGAADSENSILHLQEFCKYVEVINHQWPDPLTCLPDLLRYFINGKPIELRLLYSQEMADKIRKLTAENNFDIVHIEHSRLALYRENIDPNSRSLSVLTFHNVAYDQFARISHIQKQIITRFRSWLFSWQLRRWEPSYAGMFTRCVTVSDLDRNILLAGNPNLQLEVIPNGTDTKKYQFLEAEQGSINLLFIGSMSYAPCVDGAVYFCDQILPLIQKKLPQVQLWLVGANPSPAVLQLACDHIHVTGYVESVLPFYQKAAVTVVPLRAGGGTRLKILEAMAFGRPVVSTAIGCEGLDVVDGQHLFIADDPAEFAEKILRLLGDENLYQRMAAEARELVVSQYDWDQISDKLVDVYSEIIQEQKRQTL